MGFNTLVPIAIPIEQDSGTAPPDPTPPSAAYDMGAIAGTHSVFQMRRGTTSQRMAVVFAQGEPILDTDLSIIFRGDGATLGGVAFQYAFGTTVGTAAQGNDSRFLTSDQKAANAGSFGTPSDINRFLTANDTAIARTTPGKNYRIVAGEWQLMDTDGTWRVIYSQNGILVTAPAA